MTDGPMYRQPQAIVDQLFGPPPLAVEWSKVSESWAREQTFRAVMIAQTEVSDYLAAERERLTKERDEALTKTGELTASSSRWTCASCGAVSPVGQFRTVTSGNPIDGVDYDVACVSCGSTHTCESPAEALAWNVTERDRIGAELGTLKAKLKELTEDPADVESDARRDVVADLRAYADAYPQNDGSACVFFAADEIERLRAKIASDEFWEKQVYPEGMNAQDVRNELHDFRVMMEEVPKVYDHVTGGRVSKPLTHAVAVIGEHDEHCHETCVETDDVEDVVDELRQLANKWIDEKDADVASSPGEFCGARAAGEKLLKYLTDFDPIMGCGERRKPSRTSLRIALHFAATSLADVRDGLAALLQKAVTTTEWTAELPKDVTALRDKAADGVAAAKKTLYPPTSDDVA